MALSKIVIENIDEKYNIEALFNPKEYTISKQTNWVEHKTKGKDVPFVHFTSGQRRSLKLDLFFDSSMEENGNVSEYVQELESLMLMMDKRNKKRPPLLFVSWGKESLNFKCVLEAMEQKYTMFNEEGTPIRAMVSVTFKEISLKQTRRFGGTRRRRSRVATENETVLCVCPPTVEGQRDWRTSARENDIDDPANIPAGTQMSMSRE